MTALRRPVLVAVVAVLACTGVLTPAAGAAEIPTGPIPNSSGYTRMPNFVGASVPASPVAMATPPQHPHMVASSHNNNMHGDSYASDVNSGGPSGNAPAVRSARYDSTGGECAGHVFDSSGRLVTVCGTIKGMFLRVYNPATLGIMGNMFLGQRASTPEYLLTLRIDKIFTDTSGGAYFYVDDQDRVVLADPNQKLRVIRITDDGSGGVTFGDDHVYDLMPYIEHDCWSLFHQNPTGKCDAVTTVLPDWDGRYWFITREGKIGTVDPGSGAVAVVDAHEEIQNSFAVDANGVYIVSDTAMYMFRAGLAGEPVQVWREPYDRGTYQKPSGQLNWGSGTTPTLIGDDLVAITDNADDMNVVYMDRRETPAGPRTLCTVPTFGAGRSASDNSLIGGELADGSAFAIVENNFGYKFFLSQIFGNSVPGGVKRIDISADRNTCSLAWTSDVRVPSSVSKLSRDTGLVYVYEKPRTANLVDAWYLTALDLATGATAWKKLVGTGWSYDNQWASLTPMPGGKLYAGVFNGLVEVADTP